MHGLLFSVLSSPNAGTWSHPLERGDFRINFRSSSFHRAFISSLVQSVRAFSMYALLFARLLSSWASLWVWSISVLAFSFLCMPVICIPLCSFNVCSLAYCFKPFSLPLGKGMLIHFNSVFDLNLPSCRPAFLITWTWRRAFFIL